MMDGGPLRPPKFQSKQKGREEKKKRLRERAPPRPRPRPRGLSPSVQVAHRGRSAGKVTRTLTRFSHTHVNSGHRLIGLREARGAPSWLHTLRAHPRDVRSPTPVQNFICSLCCRDESAA